MLKYKIGVISILFSLSIFAENPKPAPSPLEKSLAECLNYAKSLDLLIKELITPKEKTLVPYQQTNAEFIIILKAINDWKKCDPLLKKIEKGKLTAKEIQVLIKSKAKLEPTYKVFRAAVAPWQKKMVNSLFITLGKVKGTTKTADTLLALKATVGLSGVRIKRKNIALLLKKLKKRKNQLRTNIDHALADLPDKK